MIKLKPTKQEVQETLSKLMYWQIISPGTALLAMGRFEVIHDCQQESENVPNR